MGTKERRLEDLGPLHDLLLRACPEKDGVRSIPVLAEQLGRSSQSLYYCINQGKISADLAKKITGLKGCHATIEEFYPFVFR